MKSIFSILLIITCTCSCKKEEVKFPYWGTATALKNDKEWGGKVYAEDNPYGKHLGIDVKIKLYNENDDLKEVLSLMFIPEKVGKYAFVKQLENSQNDSFAVADHYTMVSDGHVIGDIYDLLPDDEIGDYVEITEIIGTEIKGIFQVSMSRNEPNVSSPSEPDTVVFTNGYFHTKILR